MGLFGGYVNFVLTAKDDPNKSRTKSMCAGVASALLVPLFLKTIGSNLLSESQLGPNELLVLAGFCLIAAISSRAFMQSLADKVLQEARKATQDVNVARQEMKEQIEKVEDLVSEPEAPVISVTVSDQKSYPANGQEIDLAPEEVAILKALTDSRFVMRTFSGIALETRIPKDKISSILDDLRKRDLAEVIDRPKGKRAVITASGRVALLNALSEKTAVAN